MELIFNIRYRKYQDETANDKKYKRSYLGKDSFN